jgi:hypothetical protein
MSGAFRALPIVLVLTLVPPSGAEEEPSQPIELLEQLGSALRAAGGWRADFDQEYVPAGMSQGEKATGKVWLAWPDRVYFETGNPVVRRMGLEGRHARLVDLEVPSCDEHILTDEDWQRVPLAAVLHPDSALDNFTVIPRGEAGLSLMPRKTGGVEEVELVLDDEHLPREVVIIDPQGARNRLLFHGWRTAEGPPEGVWLPSPPPGLSCIAEAP